MQKITPFLWFDQNAEEAVNFYTSVFDHSKILGISRYGRSGPGPQGSIMTIRFELQGQEFVALNGGPTFKFNEAVSLVVNCKNQEELDRYWNALLKGGSPQQCGWVKDRYGLSWQIVPTVLTELLTDGDAAKSDRVMKAVLGMIKLDIDELKRAAEEGAVAR